MTTETVLEQLCINTIRTLSIDAVQKANSGHPGLPMGAAPMAYVLWKNHLHHHPKNPHWIDRDRFVLSAGHGSILLYTLLHLTGYDLTLDDLRSFRQWKSSTPGHPEFLETPGVEATTGPLGQGTANAVGMALAERALAARFNCASNEIVNHFTYALVSDGDLMEGVSAEAASLAGQLKLSKLIYLYDQNDVTLDGPAEMTFSVEDVARRYEAYGWQVLRIADGDHDISGIDEAIREAKTDTDRPSIIIVRTTIGFGSPNKQGTSSAHGAPLGKEEIELTKQKLGWKYEEEFFVPDEVRVELSAIDSGRELEVEWNENFAKYRRQFPDLANELDRRFRSELPDGWDKGIPSFEVEDVLATREASGQVLNAIALSVPELIGGDADLSSSTKTNLVDHGSFSNEDASGRNIHFGVREHAMGGIVNGMAYHGGVRSYASTFFVFSDYMRPAVRIAALSELPTIYVWTHDSVGVGEDGPTHQPVEHLASLRALPNLYVLRPADANETVEAWRIAMERKDGPTALVLTRQKIPTFDRSKYADAAGTKRGAYVIADVNKGDQIALVIIATGSEVGVALEAREILIQSGVSCRVVSMPCWELFEAQSKEYKESVLPSYVTARVSIEAGVTLGWHRYVGDEGHAIGIDRFGSSAPGDIIFNQLELTPENVVKRAKQLL